MKTIIFDFDGVIHDTFELAHEIFGENMSKDEYRNLFNGNIHECHKVEKEKHDGMHKLQREVFKSLKADENIKNKLEMLSEKHVLFIVSSNQEEALNTYFQNNNFTHVFKEILGAESHQSKVEKFKYLFRKYDLKVKDCIFVTDTLGDILEGNKVGLRTIAVDFGFHERERLEKGNPFKIVSSFDEVMEVIKEM
ncbi:MAG: hypothetical protein ACD_9C00327G0002 [uncultured bacterium]|nr:MAG: hypothetical protein ACD_9C00327G0002 [uncultured bacterium]KKQ46411.1 MAG: hypothetical protein US63_C0002G0024 [Candidatus Moranbacteria bacterium GW2011_GWC2_37_8]KKQ62734.1 MAG: phosphatase, phosphoglycolate phosphatase [Parcubacteria group bacterium GW2011_GWC1_38_22]